MKRHIYGIGVFLITQLLMSCTDCGCQKFNINAHFDINDMHVGFVDSIAFQNYYSYDFDTATAHIRFLQDSVEIPANQAKLLVYFSGTYFAYNKSGGFELINTAYACDPIQKGQSGSIEPVDSFYIVPISGKFGVDSFYTDTLYTVSHTAYTSYIFSDTTTVDLRIQDPYSTQFNYNSISYLVAKPKLYFNMALSPPLYFTTTDFVQLKVVLKLRNGERYERVTKHIRLI